MPPRRGLRSAADTPTAVEAVEKSAGKFIVYVSRQGKKEFFSCDLAVDSAGRVPDIDDLGLEKANVEREKNGGVKVNGYLQSPSNPAVYAGGDAAATYGLPLTPVSSYDGKVIASNLLEGNHLKVEYDAIPTVVCTIPPRASVGLSDDAAKKAAFISARIIWTWEDGIPHDGWARGLLRSRCL